MNDNDVVMADRYVIVLSCGCFLSADGGTTRSFCAARSEHIRLILTYLAHPDETVLTAHVTRGFIRDLANELWRVA